MGFDSKIEWCHASFNPWYGCQKIGPGCDHCYAEGWAKRSGLVQWGPGSERRRSSTANWRKPLKWNAEAERLGVRYRVFCASLADVFDNAVPQEWRMDLFSLIAKTPHLDWLLVTKRVGNVMAMSSSDSLMFDMLAQRVWLGITVCNQEEADRDIPKLLQIPSKVRWLSMEPLLGPVDLTGGYLAMRCGGQYPFKGLAPSHRPGLIDLLDWVVVGGESGHHGRPMHPEWVRSLRNQCKAANVPFLFKQWGENLPSLDATNEQMDRAVRGGWVRLAGGFHDGNDATLFVPGDEHVLHVGATFTGRLLDGVLHDEYPKTINIRRTPDQSPTHHEHEA